MKQKTPQKYFVPELNISIKVDWVSYKTCVAHFPNGLERVRDYEMKSGEWKHQGVWKEQEVKND